MHLDASSCIPIYHHESPWDHHESSWIDHNVQKNRCSSEEMPRYVKYTDSDSRVDSDIWDHQKCFLKWWKNFFEFFRIMICVLNSLGRKVDESDLMAQAWKPKDNNKMLTLGSNLLASVWKRIMRIVPDFLMPLRRSIFRNYLVPSPFTGFT